MKKTSRGPVDFRRRRRSRRKRLGRTVSRTVSRLAVEALEPRRLLAGDLQHNTDLPADVNGDSRVNPFDLVLVAREISARSPVVLGQGEASASLDGVFLDVTGDGRLNVLDLLGVATQIRAAGEGDETANDPPVNSVPGSQTVDEDQVLTFASGSLSVNDVDAGPAGVSVHLGVNNGVLSVNTTGAVVNGDGTKDVTVSGDLQKVNQALNGLRYAPLPNFHGSDTLTVTSDDLGNTGTGGPMTDVDTVDITIRPVADLPLLDAPIIVGLVDEGTVTFDGGIDIRVTDIDQTGDTFSVGGQVRAGTLNVVGDVQVSGNGTRSVFLEGTTDQINDATITYVHDGSSQLEILALFATNVANPLTVFRQVDFDFAGTNTDVRAIPDFVNVLEDSTTVIDVTANDIVSGTSGIVQPGESESNTAQGGAVRQDGGTLTYTPPTDFSGTDSFTYTIEDTNSGATSSTQVQINVFPVNDPPILSDLQETISADDQPLTISLNARDVDDDPSTLDYFLTSRPAAGRVTNNLDGTLTFDPAGDFDDLLIGETQNVNIDLLARDPQFAVSEESTITVTVNGVRRAEPPAIRVTPRIFARPDNYPFDGDGNRVLATNEITTIGVGQEFVVKLLVEDIRAQGTREGVFSTYVDVNFDNPELASLIQDLPGVVHPQTGEPTPYLHNLVDPVSGDPLFGQRAEPVTGDGFIDTDGDGQADQIDLLGSFSGRLRGTGPGEFVLAEWAMLAELSGSLNITPEPTTEDPSDDPNDAGESPLFDAGIFGQDAPVCPSQSTQDPCKGELEFLTATLDIVGDIVAIDDSVTLSEDAPPTTIDVLVNDVSESAGNLQVTEVASTALGTVVNNGSDITYTPTRNAFGTEVFSYTISNGLGAFDTAAVTVEITPVNDPPINAVPGPQVVDEDRTLLLPPIVVNDDDGNVPLTVHLSSELGTVVVPVNPDVTISNNDSTDVTVSGAVEDIIEALSTISYVPLPDVNGDDSLTVESDDGTENDIDTINITIRPINDPPINTVPGAQTLFNTDTLQFSAGDFTVTDVDASTLDVQLSVGEGTLAVDPTDGVEVNGNDSGTLSLRGLTSGLNQVLGGLRYDPLDTFAGIDTLEMTTSDLGESGAGGNLTDTDTVQLTVTPPRVPFASSDFFEVEEDVAFALFDLLANDLRPLPAIENTVSVTHINDQPFLGTATTDQGGTIEFDATEGNFRYAPRLDFFGLDSFTYTIASTPDAGDGPSTAEVTIDVLPINDGPVNTVPGPQVSGEDQPLTIGGLSVADVDADPVGLSVTLTVNSGTLTVGNGDATVQNNGSSQVVIDGSVADINTRINQITYVPQLNFFGADQLRITSTDGGNHGGAPGAPNAGNPLLDEDTVDITIRPINDGPVIVVPGSQTFFTDFDNQFSPDPLRIEDIDAGSADVQIDLLIDDGTMTVSTSNGLQVTPNPDGLNGLRLIGTVDAINDALLAGLNYNTTTPGNKTLSATVNDLGNVGGSPDDLDAGHPLSASGQVEIEVLDFVPSNIGGFVFMDIDNDARRDRGDFALEGVPVRLTGFSFRNDSVSRVAVTDRDGSYLFSGLAPGDYVLSADQPANTKDGRENFEFPAVADGNDRAKIHIPLTGNVDSRENNFGERGFTTPFLSMFDLVDSSFQRSGIFLSSSGGTDFWTMFLSDTWDGFSKPTVDLEKLQLKVRNERNQTEQTVDLSAPDPKLPGRTLRDRLIIREHDGDTILRVNGSPADFGLIAADLGHHNQGDESFLQYAEGVDQVFGEWA